MRLERLTAITVCGAAIALLVCGCGLLGLDYENEEAQWQSARFRAEAAMKKHDYAAAEEQYKAALKHARKVEKISPLHAAETLRSLGDLAWAQGKSSLARDYYQQALKSYEQIAAAPNSSEMYRRLGTLSHACTIASLGDVYRKEGDADKAEQYYEQALKAKGTGLGATVVSIPVAHGRVLIGDERRVHGDLSGAEKFYTLALKTNGLDLSAAATYAEAGQGFVKLANDFRDSGNFDKSEDLYKVAMGVAKAAESQPLAEEIKKQYAILLKKSGRADDPLRLEREVPTPELY